MMQTAKCRLALYCAGGALAVACSFPAGAQFSSGTGGGRRGMRSPDAAAAQDPASPRAVSAADALYEVRMRLLISQEQAPAWERFYRAYIGWLALAGNPRPAASTGGALQSVQQQLTLAQNRFAATEDLDAALKALFTALSEAQQQTADDLLPRLLALTSPSGQRISAR
jgi:hypothetical protein